MLPIDAAEFSAFLDGELPAERAEEVRAALAADPVLRRAYEQMVACDADWRGRAAAAMFRPRVRVDRAPSARPYLATVIVVLSLLLLRMALKTLPPLYAAGLEAILLAIVVGWGVRRIMRTTDADRGWSVLASGC